MKVANITERSMFVMSSESAAASQIRLDAAQCNVTLMRNNVGVAQTHDNRPVRYGLCNESKKQNKVLKSSDLIGITPVLITSQMVDQVLGIFTAVETKHNGWTYKGDEREFAQQNFIDLVLRNGGYAGFANDVNSFRRIIKL